MIKPMLAHRVDLHRSKIFFPAYVQPKLDGIRGLVHPGVGVFSRSGKAITGCPELVERLKNLPIDPEIILDGEFYSPCLTFERISGLMRRSKNTEEETQLSYYAFDLAVPERSFDHRTTELEIMITEARDPQIQFTPTFWVVCQGEMDRRFAAFEKDGYEGLIWRSPSSSYEFGKRSFGLMKLKRTKEVTVEATGFLPGKGKHVGVLGAIMARLPSGKLVKIGTGLTDEQRRYIWYGRDQYLGQSLKIGYQELTNNGVPRFPVFIGWIA